MVDQSGVAIHYHYDAAEKLDVLRDGGGNVMVDYDCDPPVNAHAEDVAAHSYFAASFTAIRATWQP